MAGFPGGAWDLEPEFADVLAWLPVLEGIEPSNALTRVQVSITKLSAAIQALSITDGPSDDDEDEDAADLSLVIPKKEKVTGGRGKKKEKAPAIAPVYAENDPPVSRSSVALCVSLG